LKSDHFKEAVFEIVFQSEWPDQISSSFFFFHLNSLIHYVGVLTEGFQTFVSPSFCLIVWNLLIIETVIYSIFFCVCGALWTWCK